MLIALIAFIVLTGLCYLALATFLTYTQLRPKPRKTPRKHPHKKVPDKYPGEEGSKLSK